MKKFLLSLLCLLAVFPAAWGVDIEVTFKNDNWGGTNQYNVTLTSTDGNWKTINFSNNNLGWNGQVKCGPKSNTNSFAYFQSAKKIAQSVSDVTIFVSEIKNGTVQSMKLYVSDDDTFDSSDDIYTVMPPTEVPSTDAAQPRFVITNPAPDKYYRIEINCSNSTNNNAVLGINKVLFTTVGGEPVDADFKLNNANEDGNLMLELDENGLISYKLDYTPKALVGLLDFEIESNEASIENDIFTTKKADEYIVNVYLYENTEDYKAFADSFKIIVAPYDPNKPKSVSFSFTDGIMANATSTWNNSYNSTRNESTTGLKFHFDETAKPDAGSKVENMPAARKSGGITVTLTEDNVLFSYVNFNLKRWGTDTNTLKLQYSTDGTNFEDFSPAVTAALGNAVSEGILSIGTESLPDGVVSVKLSGNASSNGRFGIASFEYKLISALKEATLAFEYFDMDEEKDHHRMTSMAETVKDENAEEIYVLHHDNFGTSTDHYDFLEASLEANGHTLSDINKGASLLTLNKDDDGSSIIKVKAHTAGIYNLVIKQTQDIEADEVKFVMPEDGVVATIPVRVSPSIRGIGLCFNWTGYMINNEGQLAIALEGDDNIQGVAKTWEETYEDENGNPRTRTWTHDNVHLAALEAEAEGLEIWYKYDDAANDENEALDPVAYLGAREASALDVATETNADPETLGYTHFNNPTKAPSLNTALANGGINFIIKQNGIIGAPEHVAVYADAANINGEETAVDAIEAAEAAEAVYYTLDGVRVTNPEKGIYIVVKGGKAQKIYKTF